MMRSPGIFRVALHLVLLPGMVVPCMYPVNWQAKDFNTRSQEASIILLGRVNEMPPLAEEGYPPMTLGYAAVVDVWCVYKTANVYEANIFLGDLVTVEPVNFTSSCAQTRVSRGGVYLLFLKISWDGLMPDEVNMEEAQSPPDPEKLEYLEEAYGGESTEGSPGCLASGTADSETKDPETGGTVDGSTDLHDRAEDDDTTQGPLKLRDATPTSGAEGKGPGKVSRAWNCSSVYALAGLALLISGKWV